MGKTKDVADNLVKMAKSLKYDDFDAKDKVLTYAGKLIEDEFGQTSTYMQKLGLIVFSPKDSAVLGAMGASEDQIQKAVFESGVKKLVELLEQVRASVAGGVRDDKEIIIIQAKDKVSAARMASHVKAKGYRPVVIKDSDDWQRMLDEML